MEASHRHTMWGPKYNHEIDELHDLARKLRLRFEFCIKDKAQNEKTFTCSLKIGNFSAKARGHTKWVAKIEATKLVLGDLRRLLPGKDTYLRSKNPANVSGYRKEAPLSTAGTNPVICLENLVNANEGNPPKYTVLSSRGDEIFKVQVSMADNGVVGIGHTYIEAKCNAADRLLHAFGYSFPYTELQQDVSEAVASAAPQNYDTKDDTKVKCPSNQKDSIQVPEVTQRETNEPVSKPDTNPVICLKNLVNANQGIRPKYTVLSCRGDEMFKLQVTVAENSAEGIGPTYGEAKCNAADRMLNAFGYSFPYTELQQKVTPLPPQDASEAVASAALQNYDTKEDTKEKCSSNQDSLQVPEVTQRETNEPVSKPDTNPVICLKNLVNANQGIPPKYTVLSCRGDEMFKLQVTVAKNSAEGIGPTYGEAKFNAADKMLNAFGYSFPYMELQQKVTPLLPQGAAVASAAPQNYVTKEDTKVKCPSNQKDSIQVPEVTQSETKEPVSKPGTNPVICLKNLVNANQGKTPKYTMLSSRGDEIYKLQVTVAENSAVGIGPTYGEAKRNAADQMLKCFGYSFPYTEVQEKAMPLLTHGASAAPQNYDTKEETKVTPCPSNQDSLEVLKVIERETNAPVSKPGTNPVICLKNLVNAYGGKPPKYTVVSCRGDEIFKLQLTVAKESVVGIGSTYGEAKCNAADQMLKTFDRPSNPEEYSLQVPVVSQRETPALLTEEPVFIPGMNPVFFLENLAIAKQWKLPKYTMLPDLGDETLQVQVTVAGQSVVRIGPTCNKARMNAAAGMLKIFGYSIDTDEDEEEVTPLPTEGAMATSQNYDITPCPSNLEYSPQVPAVTRRETPYNVTSPVAEDNSVQVQGLLLKVLPSIAFMKMNDNCKETVLLSNEEVSTEKKDLLAAMEVTEDHSGNIELSEPETTKIIATETIEDTPDVSLEGSSPVIQEVIDEVLSPSVDPLAAKEVIGDHSGNIELSKPETTRTPEVILEGSCLDIQEVAQGDAPQIEMEVLSLSLSEPETKETVLPSEVIEERECPPKTTQTIVADTKDKMSYVDLQTLCPKMRSLLASMQVVKENNGIVQWDLSKPTKSIQDSQTLSPPEIPTTMDTSDAPVETEGHAIDTNTSSQTTVVSDETENSIQKDNSSTAVVNISREESVTSHSNSTHQEESQSDNNSPVLHFGPLVNSILTRALVEKTLKKAFSREEYDALVKRLEKKTIDALIVGDAAEINSEKLREIGKKAAQKLLKEYGTRSNLLEAARRTDDKAFEEAVVKHLNIQLKTYKNRPKSALSRLWSRIRSAFTRSS